MDFGRIYKIPELETKKTLLVTEIAITRISALSCADTPSPKSQRVTQGNQVTAAHTVEPVLRKGKCVTVDNTHTCS